MKILFLGLGSIGLRHAGLIRNLFPDHTLFAMRTRAASAGIPGTREASDLAMENLGIREVRDWVEAGQLGIEAAFITNPTHMHVPTALECARRGWHLFIEKPIGTTMSGVKELQAAVRERGLTAYVAYDLRFHPVVEALRNMIRGSRVVEAEVVCTSWMPAWRPGRDHLATYSARADMGGGVLLDLSHEIDYAAYLFGNLDRLRGRMGRRAEVTLDAEDFAELETECAGGAHVRIRLDFADRREARTVAIRLADGRVLEGDLNGMRIRGSFPEAARAFAKGANLAYENQLRHFFGNLGRADLMNGLDEAVPIFKRIAEFKEGR